MKNLLIWTMGGKNWMGGVYHTRSLIFQLSLLDNVSEKYNVYLLREASLKEEFDDLKKCIDMMIIDKTDDKEQLLKICEIYKIDVVLPTTGTGSYSWLISEMCVYLIPDFQEIHLSNNFTQSEICFRGSRNGYIAKKHQSIILSSEDVCNDYFSQYPNYSENVFMVHFVSYIENVIEKINDKYVDSVLKKYQICYEYIYIANQFWKHKNHIVALRALKRIIESGRKDVHIVCTGFMKSYGEADEYVQSLIDYIKENNIEEYVHFLGLISREEQLAVMRNANLLLQPSLFEGWGCGVNDAKAMGKTILLSDIEVHNEIKNDNCFLFNKNDDEQLAELILEKFNSVKKFDLSSGREETYQNAKAYALELEKAINAVQPIDNAEKKWMKKLYAARKEKALELFGDMKAKYIGIYGTGRHTDLMLKDCEAVLDNVNFVFFDSDEAKWRREYHGGYIYSPKDIIKTGVKRIVISTIQYQNEIYQSIEEYKNIVDIRKVYETTEEENEILWW